MQQEHLVRDFMTSPASSLPHDASLLDAALMLRRTGFRHLPVVDGEQVVGILSDRDIQRLSPSLLSKVTQEEYNAILENTPVERVMIREVATATPSTPLREAATLLYERKLGCLPVIEEGQLVGMITITDMLAALRRLLAASESEPAVERR